MLPVYNKDIVCTHLAADTELKVVDMLEVSRSRSAISSSLESQVQSSEARTITELEDGDEQDEQNTRSTSKTPTVKYTVRDSANTMAYMLPVSGYAANLKLGSVFTLSKGTEIWRSVLVPRAEEISRVRGGKDMTIEQQLARLKHP